MAIESWSDFEESHYLHHGRRLWLPIKDQTIKELGPSTDLPAEAEASKLDKKKFFFQGDKYFNPPSPSVGISEIHHANPPCRGKDTINPEVESQ